MEKLAAKQTVSPLLFRTYKLIKKIIKYSLFITILYFAYKGFMAWN
ncbi:hypothetical protein NZD88_09440 [Chryseobacterium antibioticum]|uniref:Uncharacterized protein n=1 Tax=Chryseobacterium pyrolae TaxID=2987481 RepID=A0ABT2IGN9_9FLAO|nr:hypothetical protein [Chryseobacterium pyrolae]MCT2407759.1 hypothetical protein [Chryseobacterium pyrolae]